jgi:hypothetical protein
MSRNTIVVAIAAIVVIVVVVFVYLILRLFQEVLAGILAKRGGEQ